MTTPKPPAEPIDSRLVRNLAEILNETGLTEIEVERDGLKIRVARLITAAASVHTVPATAPAPPPLTAPPANTTVAPTEDPVGETVKSPMVGTVYLQAQPGSPPFIKAGDTVTEGQTLLLVEAMKTMNPISAPRAGKILRLLVADSQPVEYGEPLILLE